ncbi:protein MpC2H2-10 [Marchantia polymorpha subsp. ruderalis]|uniref:C2H2-type domain-containing protein n=1 Tax=Marchantia polymorpha TaxID=3197 RepID=A0A2R6WPE7_MARPO|nr:hypothetical protein MARPO_0069s0060 [Marchantia polymorpha]BBN03515.1 hypothetical protein Mp_2g24110 [Marchantia polymorpha subsp. ruderalis]|eukprot:PTQ35721.1 hypothetical protein MARPO_0069s0060 [Marchantia polymorpha]
MLGEVESVTDKMASSSCTSPSVNEPMSGTEPTSADSVSEEELSLDVKPIIVETTQAPSCTELVSVQLPAINTTTTSATLNVQNNEKQQGVKRKRNLPGTPDPDAEVVALSPKTLMATHKFTCEVCGRGFQREQNLQLHKRGHNLPGSLKPRANKDKEIRKKVYVCPEPTCVHHDPARALGDLTGIKKHFCRKHGEKKWKCDKCCKKYAVLSDWKAHSKTCGTRDYKCECGSIFYRRDSFVTHKAFCDELAEESARLAAGSSEPPAPVLLLDAMPPEDKDEPVSYRQLLGEDDIDDNDQAGA